MLVRAIDQTLVDLGEDQDDLVLLYVGDHLVKHNVLVKLLWR